MFSRKNFRLIYQVVVQLLLFSITFPSFSGGILTKGPSGRASKTYTIRISSGKTNLLNDFEFNFTGNIEIWTVPAGVYALDIEVRGAEGGYNTRSVFFPGKGAIVKGTFAVTPGQQLKILVGQQPSATSGNGGGGGSFVTDINNNPLIIAGGGGGSSQDTDSPDKHGQAGTKGGTGAAGGGEGGINGNGGKVGPSGFQSGAGGGLLTNGEDGWATGSGGIAFVNGGSPTSVNGSAFGGGGGGGSGSSYVVGGGGGGYSGGGSGGNNSGGVGGGGGSYNGGSNASSLVAENGNSGHGKVIINVSNPCASITPSNVTISKIPADTPEGKSKFSAVAPGASYVFTGPNGYVFSSVYRTDQIHTVYSGTITTNGQYTLSVFNSNGCLVSNGSISF